ncbi:hypothetical protein PDIG_25760 [Penicillium digitatum PHI26]|uniref:TauD/TfdA-like domain-containing protein n=2 Tax=Penicillium digitatum TaxID=36651 RepID=K9G0I0_PEND2|nr:hypothetical protein PDIP_60240 [Penicillium digitatum Pd1]EKV10440.1 hypothetical protein PDIP_60240 [Penicillium digitatum Pd1]EKV15455.1 hypothetical protein PDIG_25760 [Penicillium digitatum PHI26]
MCFLIVENVNILQPQKSEVDEAMEKKPGLLPSTSGLHIYPVANSGREHGVKDDEISVISSVGRKKLYKSRNSRKQSARREWHSDITFEPIPSNYTLLRLTELPQAGGDTLWASGYEVYDRISEPYQKFLESLTATYAQPEFNEIAKRNNFHIHVGPRGAPENVGEALIAEHPVIRTNPVTGWKSVIAVGSHVQKVNGVSEEESRHLLDWFVTLIVENHDLQVRNRWLTPNDLAIWDNRSVYHAATWDYDGLGPRTGHRAVGLGERPYLDPKSIGRREALAKDPSTKCNKEEMHCEVLAWPDRLVPCVSSIWAFFIGQKDHQDKQNITTTYICLCSSIDIRP